jgi:hypothetical protein
MTNSWGGDLNVFDWATATVTTRVKAHKGEPFAVTCDYHSATKDIYVGDAEGGLTRYEQDGSASHMTGKGAFF